MPSKGEELPANILYDAVAVNNRERDRTLPQQIDPIGIDGARDRSRALTLATKQYEKDGGGTERQRRNDGRRERSRAPMIHDAPPLSLWKIDRLRLSIGFIIVQTFQSYSIIP
ncbi:hypothetical protein OMP38_05010 [Cohnella ginsengisoli]|uniref:Uncharacterized protein n=1 Tax=Cohnella ginsengisoli TaxID=425004 RepID=A0A9X4QL34_9BACL|nr:hypothetical protein [Cohnella ginsengisoli]MDG0790279.1 hypothetical protein [Cohnella ginsengisoli]